MIRNQFPPHLLSRPWRSLATVLLAGGGVLAATPTVSADQGLGRLFLSAEKRERLDRQRALNTLESRTATEEPLLVVNGQVRRSTGGHTTWINGQPYYEGETRTGITPRPVPDAPGHVIIDAANAPRMPTVRVGEFVNRDTHETSSPLDAGAVVIHSQRKGNAR